MMPKRDGLWAVVLVAVSCDRVKVMVPTQILEGHSPFKVRPRGVQPLSCKTGILEGISHTSALKGFANKIP